MTYARRDVSPRGSLRAAVPAAVPVPGVVEMLRHLFELRAGFHESLAAMKAAEHASSRMAAGHFKVLALLPTGWWAACFHACGDDPAAARAWDPRRRRCSFR